VVVADDGGELLVDEAAADDVELEMSANVRIAFAKKATRRNESFCILNARNDSWWSS
jgi:hypothetical protein